MNFKYSVGVLVVSDSCSSGLSADQSGLNLKDLINKHDEKIYKTIDYCIVSDDIPAIKAKLIEWSDDLKLDLILTTGGTGLSPRDVTPEATKEVITKEVSSLTNTILVESLKITPFAMLSRAVCGIRNKTLIINLPGSKKGSQESLNIVLPVLKHALDLINDSKSEIKKDHVKIQHSHTSRVINTHDCQKLKSAVTSDDIVRKPRHSEFPMISVDEALAIILSKSDLLDTEEVFYLNAIGRISATNVYAQDPLPPFPASVKDGFAVKLTEKQKSINSNDDPYVFEVIGSSHAGDDINIVLKEGQCVKINTGAPVPLKADAVIQIEDTISLEKNSKGQDAKIQIVASGTGCGGGNTNGKTNHVKIQIGQDIRSIGFDIKKGEMVMNERCLINAAQIGVCATVGALNLKVFKPPLVGLISTGNELRKPEEANLTCGQIRDANKSLLHAALKSFGLDNVFDAGICHDDPDSVLQVFKNAMEKTDVIISTGGVSMGDKDLVKEVLIKDLKCDIHFARMNMKPGKPTTFASTIYQGRRKLFFCLPGNPVSAIVTFNLVVLPCLKKMMGFTNPFHTEIKVKCEFDVDQLDPRPEYHRVFIEWSNQSTDSYYPSAFSTGNQHSSRLLSMNKANALVKLPGKTDAKISVKKGDILSALIIEKI